MSTNAPSPDNSRRSERLNVRLSTDALLTIREAASVQQQDLTSFVLGAALDRSRSILMEDRLMRLTPHEVGQLEDSLDRDPEVNEVLAARIRRIRQRNGAPLAADTPVDA